MPGYCPVIDPDFISTVAILFIMDFCISFELLKIQH
jgi:hypothetical protein